MENYDPTFNLITQVSVNKVTVPGQIKSSLKLKIELKQNPVFKRMQNQNVRLLH